MTRRPTIHLPVLVVLSALALATFSRQPSAFADEPPPGSAGDTSRVQQPPRRESTLDDELLKDLERDSLDTALPAQKNANEKSSAPAAVRGGNKPAARSGSNQPAAAGDDRDQATRDLDRALLEGLQEGDDLGSPGESNPFARLNYEMREAEQRLAHRRSGADTRSLQDQIVRHLDELIKEAEKSAKKSRSQSGDNRSRSQQSRRSDASQPDQQASQSGAADAPANQSTQRVRQEEARKPDAAELREVLKGVWGQLPERQREQMLQSYEEQFLPKYEQMISDYFRSIAEEPDRKR